MVACHTNVNVIQEPTIFVWGNFIVISFKSDAFVKIGGYRYGQIDVKHYYHIKFRDDHIDIAVA